MEEEPRKRYQNYRSDASNNWRVKDDSPRAEAPARPQQRPQDQRRDSPAGQAAETVTGTRLYVGNLLYSAQTKDVEQLFADNGFTVTHVNMSTDPFTGRNPSYCFVDLETPEDANRAMTELNGKDVMGRAVRINPGVAKKSFASSPASSPRIRTYDRGERGERPERSERGGRGWQAGEPRSNSENYKPSFDRWSRNDASDQLKGVSEQGKRLYVGGLPRMEPQSAVDAEMQKLFEGFELVAVSKNISPHPSKASTPGNHYYLFIDFPTSEDADAAAQALNGQESTWGGKLIVNKARGESKKAPREPYSRNRNEGEVKLRDEDNY